MIAAIKQQSQPTTKWYPMFANLGDYRGWGIQMVLILNQGDRYRVEVTKFHTSLASCLRCVVYLRPKTPSFSIRSRAY
ncbi:hypothetical protein [Coleofasciculus sp.]|uniref:hypothetical protein n=1 Tax=Coleofasciculus sp. TaxID=3100458 RepID=UPI0039F92657